MGYQNFYATKLTNDIGAADTSIVVDQAPTALTGRLVLEARNPTQREIIKYTGVSGNTLTGVLRGQGGTTAKPHLKSSLVEMNATSEDLQDLYDAFTSFTATNNDWFPLLPAVTAVTHNGNRNYTLTFASSVGSLVSENMRMKFVKSVAGNAYMGGAFNGSSQYFTKTTPSGTLGTVTNNFTIEAVVQPTSYATAAQYIAARMDSTPNNGFGLMMEQNSGQVSAIVYNGGSGNYRKITTYQSLPLNKKTHVAASWSSAGPAVTIYFDGVAVSAYQSAAGGTNPTTAGTGGDFSIGRAGAFTGAVYYAGYISNVAVFDAVLTAATIRQHATYKLTGSETNCIGAWSLDNTAVNQQAPGTNDLTAQGGVGYTAMSPHGQMSDGVQPLQACGLVMNVSTDGLMVTVQCPEGITIPTSGGLASVYYSPAANPFGYPKREGMYEVFDTNGWRYDPTAEKTIYRRRHTYSQAFTATSATAITLSQSSLPVGMSALGTNTVLHNIIQTGSAFTMNYQYEGSAASTSLNFTGYTFTTATYTGYIDVVIIKN